jgi:hypothetical protein
VWSSWIQLRQRNESFEQFTLNECISVAGDDFYTWQKETRHKQRKWWQDLLKGWNCLDEILNETWWPYIAMLMVLVSRLVHIYSIVYFGQFLENSRSIRHFWGYFIPMLSLCINLDKKTVLGCILSDLFHILFWSPWRGVSSVSTLKTHFPQVYFSTKKCSSWSRFNFSQITLVNLVNSSLRTNRFEWSC